MDLPVITESQPRERADAVANRQRILEAATRLFAERGVSCTSMDAIAAEAGVGKGTVFRRFGDRASLALAILDASEVLLQESLIRGPAPLGPGAPPEERLVAFGEAMLDRLEEHREVLLAAEAAQAGGALRSAPHNVHRTHVRHLLGELGRELDVEYLADALLLPLGAQIFTDQRVVREIPLARLKASYGDLVRRVAASGPGDR